MRLGFNKDMYEYSLFLCVINVGLGKILLNL